MAKQELIPHDYLQPLGLFIQSRLRVFICSHCESALLPKSVARHFSELHKDIHMNVDEAKILAVALSWKLCDAMPTVQSPAMMFQGLTLHEDCIKCPSCARVFTRGTISSHHSREHSAIPTPGFDKLVPIYAQKLNNGQHKSLFEVTVPLHSLAPSSTNMIINHLRISRNNLLPNFVPTTTDPRSLSSWMKYTGWHTFVKEHPTSSLIALVAMPQKNEPDLEKLKAVVTSIFDSGYQTIETTNTIVLQKLKTDDQMGKCVIHSFYEYCNISLIMQQNFEPALPETAGTKL